MTILDGTMGTELERLGVDTSGPAWSARAVVERPEVVREIHAAHARAGADVITACTFRATRRALGEGWRGVAERAVALARECGARVAGSIAPLEDCWHPERSPAIDDPDGARREHEALAEVLAGAGCDVLLCETFANVEEGLIALEAGVATGLESWLSFTPGYQGDLLGTQEVRAGAARAVDAGASAVLVNCSPARGTVAYVKALAAGVQGRAAVGAYANAMQDGVVVGADAYGALASVWIDAGASIVGGCCHAGPGHVEAVRRVLSMRTWNAQD